MGTDNSSVTCSNIDLPMSEERLGFPFSNIRPYCSTAPVVHQLPPSSSHHSIHGSHINSDIYLHSLYSTAKRSLCWDTQADWLAGWLGPPEQWVSQFPMQYVQSDCLPDGLCSQTELKHFLHHQATAILCKSALICLIFTHLISSVLSLLSSHVLKHA